MTCLCGHNETCSVCDPDPQVAELKKILQQIADTVEDAMGECQSGKSLMSFRWIGKLANRGLGKVDD